VKKELKQGLMVYVGDGVKMKGKIGRSVQEHMIVRSQFSFHVTQIVGGLHNLCRL
jgi:hypothetical protein